MGQVEHKHFTGPEKDKYRHALCAFFKTVQETMDFEGVHPVGMGTMRFEEFPNGRVDVCAQVDLQPGRTNQTFREWFFSADSGEVEETKQTH
jgi:hypothetical protein